MIFVGILYGLRVGSHIGVGALVTAIALVLLCLVDVGLIMTGATECVTKMNLIQVRRAAPPWLSDLLVFLVMITYIRATTLNMPHAIFGPRTPTQ